ncbi:MAG: tetratricopeptide repeat protein [Candidatus Omnitrophica bacterium]|nr:tetratricopeptide repeat protein [Candidatus Omnitrophota bacterium]
MVFPVVCLSYLFLVNKEIKRNIIGWQVLGWSIVVVSWFVARKLAIGSVMSFSTIALMNTSIANLPMTFLYFGKIFLPFNLSILPILPDSNLLYGFFCMIGFSVFLFFCSKENWKYVIFGLFWFFVFLMMAFLKSYWSMAHDFQEHRIYLPMVGFVIALAALKPPQQWRHRNAMGMFSAVVFFLLFVGIQFNHGEKYKDRLSFWVSASKDSPSSPLARRNLGGIYYLAGMLDLSEKEHKRALFLNPHEVGVHNNLGLIYMNQGKPVEAEKEFLQELSIRPNSSLAFYNLGILYYNQGFQKEAEGAFLESIKYNPDYVDAYRMLSISAHSQGDFEKSNQYLKEVRKRGKDIDFSLTITP